LTHLDEALKQNPIFQLPACHYLDLKTHLGPEIWTIKGNLMPRQHQNQFKPPSLSPSRFNLVCDPVFDLTESEAEGRRDAGEVFVESKN
jgi:hypothetical protein